jgi:hypothetical protein
MRPGAARRIALAIALVSPAAPAGAVEPRPLPAFELLDLGGQAVSSGSLGASGPWLLVYVTPGSGTSQAVLRGLPSGEDAPGRHVVVVVGGTREEARALRETGSRAPEDRWYADPRGEAFAQLKLRGAPTVLGLRAGRIAWALQGTPVEGPRLRSILRSWVAVVH